MPIVTFLQITKSANSNTTRSHAPIRINPTTTHWLRPPIHALVIHATVVHPEHPPTQHVHCLPPWQPEEEQVVILRSNCGAKSTQAVDHPMGGSPCQSSNTLLRDVPHARTRLGASSPVQGPLCKSGGKEAHRPMVRPPNGGSLILEFKVFAPATDG